MPYSHHSHSGSFCKHAHDDLESIINVAREKKFKTFCLTEHIPRLNNNLLYPEELEVGMTPSKLAQQFSDYVQTARKYQLMEAEKGADGLKLLVGFETEGGIDDDHLKLCEQLRTDINADIIVGSVHHIDGIDIDFDQKTWNEALANHGGDLRKLYLRYFTLIHEMIERLKPEIVAHFDLIRLFSFIETKDGKLSYEKHLGIDLVGWPDVWDKIVMSVDLIVKHNLVVELNSAAIRKGWDTPYPKDDVMELMISKGVKFALSDDSHGMDQIGLNYEKVLKYIQKMKIDRIWYYDIEGDVSNQQYQVTLKSVTIEELLEDEFWATNFPKLEMWQKKSIQN